MFPSLVAFFLFIGVESSFPYPPFNGINHHSRMENIFDSVELSNLRALQSNKVTDCDRNDILNAVGLEELQEVLEAVAARKGVSPFAVLRMLNKRMRSKEEMEETLLNTIEGAPLPDILNPPVMELPPPVKIPPASSRVPYSLPPNVPINTGNSDETKVVLIPVAPSVLEKVPAMKSDAKHRKETSILNNLSPPVGRLGHMLPVFPMLSPIKNNQLRPPLGATVHVDSGDPLSPISRDITVTVSPLMTFIEALRQAENKYRNVLGLSHDTDVITFAHSSTIDCYIVNSIDNVVQSDNSGWKVTIADRDGQVVYDNFCLPNGKDISVKPGTVISLTYVPL